MELTDRLFFCAVNENIKIVQDLPSRYYAVVVSFLQHFFSSQTVEEYSNSV